MANPVRTSLPERPKAQPARTDPLDDTPSCSDGTRLQDCPDYRNLMFPRFPAESGLTLTTEQIAVIRRNPILHEP